MPRMQIPRQQRRQIQTVDLLKEVYKRKGFEAQLREIKRRVDEGMRR